MTHVEATPRRIREHVEHVVHGAAGPPLRDERLLLLPNLLNVGLDGAVVVSHAAALLADLPLAMYPC